MVHGVFFRDSKLFNYWGRIPRTLKLHGATIYYGEHQSALTVKESARELASRIKLIVDRSGCEKVNIIAHSKGGLDCRYAISEFGLAPYVASLTTVNTPHRGCIFADKLIDAAPEKLKEYVSLRLNKCPFGENKTFCSNCKIHCYKNINELPEHIFDELKHFLSVYKQLENKNVEVNELGDAFEARKCIKYAV